VRQQPIMTIMADPSTEEKLDIALRKMELGKTLRKSGILPEVVKVACYNSEYRILRFNVGRRQGFKRLGRSVLFPNPKKG